MATLLFTTVAMAGDDVDRHCECPICGEEYREHETHYSGSYWTPPESDVHVEFECEHVWDVDAYEQTVTFARVWFIKWMATPFMWDVCELRRYFQIQWKWFGPRVWKWRRPA